MGQWLECLERLVESFVIDQKEFLHWMIERFELISGKLEQFTRININDVAQFSAASLPSQEAQDGDF